MGPNSLGGRTIDILTSKAGVEMLTYHADTSKVDTAAMFKVGLKGELTLNPESLLYRTVVGKYQFLTPFRTRSSDLEFMVDRVNKNAFLNKFHAKAKVDKDSTNVLNLEISTDHQPYKFHIFCPAIFGKLRSGMTEVDVTVDHVLGQHLYLEVLHASSPIVTDMHFTYDLAAHDLEGTFKKVLAGKEYSITFPRGSFKMPSIKIGA